MSDLRCPTCGSSNPAVFKLIETSYVKLLPFPRRVKKLRGCPDAWHDRQGY